MSSHAAGQAADPLRVVFRDAHASQYPGRTFICTQGDPATHVFLIDEGSAALTRGSADGSELINAFRAASSILGTAAAILGRAHTVSITTLSPSRIRALPVEVFLEALGENRELSASVHRMHSEEIEEQTERISGLALKTARQRIEDFLRKLAANTRESKARVQLPFTQTELARYIVVSRQSLNRLLKELEEEGIVRRSRGWYVLDLTRLSSR
jgi:CRP-like cAMP-binding protein